MASVYIPDELLQQLASIAARENRTPAEVLESWIGQYQPETAPELVPDEEDIVPGSLADMARTAEAFARSLGLDDQPKVNTSQNSREILETEYADYLKSRLEDHDRPQNSD